MIEKDTITDDMYSKAEELDSYAVEVRYPDDWCEPAKEEARAAYDIALEFKAFVESKIVFK